MAIDHNPRAPGGVISELSLYTGLSGTFLCAQNSSTSIRSLPESFVLVNKQKTMISRDVYTGVKDTGVKAPLCRTTGAVLTVGEAEESDVSFFAGVRRCPVIYTF
jgi:hypothetical protein